MSAANSRLVVIRSLVQVFEHQQFLSQMTIHILDYVTWRQCKKQNILSSKRHEIVKHLRKEGEAISVFFAVSRLKFFNKVFKKTSRSFISNFAAITYRNTLNFHDLNTRRSIASELRCMSQHVSKKTQFRSQKRLSQFFEVVQGA